MSLFLTITSTLACVDEMSNTVPGKTQVSESSVSMGDSEKTLDSALPITIANDEAEKDPDAKEKSLIKDDGPFLSVSLLPDSIARYRVQEQLAKFNLPNDAIGETKDVDGEMIFSDMGLVLPGSGFSLNVSSIISDESRRDRYVRRNTLKSDMFPTIEFDIKDVRDLTWPLPDDQGVEFQLLGDLTVKDITKPVTWNVSANFIGDIATGSASVIITFEQFSIDKPKLAFILSVEDEIRLELEFNAKIYR